MVHINHIDNTMNIVAAYVAKNSVPAADLPALIKSVYATIEELGRPPAPPAVVEPLVPAVSVKKSVTDDYLICLDNGLKFKSLKRHLTTLGMTPEQYRAKWDLPKDYPMVAPNYAARRSDLARSLGLGRKADAGVTVQ